MRCGVQTESCRCVNNRASLVPVPKQILSRCQSATKIMHLGEEVIFINTSSDHNIGFDPCRLGYLIKHIDAHVEKHASNVFCSCQYNTNICNVCKPMSMKLSLFLSKYILGENIQVSSNILCFVDLQTCLMPGQDCPGNFVHLSSDFRVQSE